MAAKKKSGARKYGKKAGEKVEKAMHERKHGTLRSGSGKKVTSRKQAIAIGLSEAREAGGKMPKKKGTKRAAKKKAASKTTAKTKRRGAKKSGARKATKKSSRTARKKS
jgi:hypothetical protein